MREIMKGRKKAAAEKPPARLEDRPGDIDMPPALFLECALFKGLAAKPNPDKLPGTLRLRTVKKGGLICREGDPGWTAFVILSKDDLSAIGKHLKEALPAEIEKKRAAGKPTDDAQALLDAGLRVVLPSPQTQPAAGEEVATVYIRPRRPDAPKPGFLARLFGAKARQEEVPGMTEYGQVKGRLRTGSVFGDWSCIYGVPRAATIRADRDLLVLEMLRNVLDKVLSNPRYQEQARQEYIERTLLGHLAGLPVFRSLTTDDLARIQQAAFDANTPAEEKIELRQCRDGEIVFDKGDAPEALYIVQRGLVKVLASIWPLLAADDILDAPRLAKALLDESASGPRRFLAGRVALKGDAAAEIAAALNPTIKDKALTGAGMKAGKRLLRPELQPLLDEPGFVAAWDEGFRAKPEEWSDRDWRGFNRLVLETAWPGTLRGARAHVEHVLNYVQKGEVFGEVGILRDKPRGAACVAYVHPRPPSDHDGAEEVEGWRTEQRIELVRLPRQMIERLCRDNPAVAEELKGLVKKVEKRDASRAVAPERPVFQSGEFQKQGLIQGQKLMLIDLDRCTRCDECVQACIDTHDDGRTRLFLDGERFGKHLVPTTCRSCRDPVCLIGCPVASIRRGPNLEMVIEDWCIGCQLCAKNCPYGSIQMHDRGLVPEQSAGWRFLPAARLQGDAWTRPGFRDGAWPQGAAPFLWDADLETLVRIAGATGPAPPLAFRLVFDLAPGVLRNAENGLKLTIGTEAVEAVIEGAGRAAKLASFVPVWINGKSVPLGEWKPEGGQQVMEIPPAKRQEWFRAGSNVLAIRATPAKHGLLLGLALDEAKPVGVIAEMAVVCDQCSTMPDKIPACVHACPHDAAMRVDAWSDDFPVK